MDEFEAEVRRELTRVAGQARLEPGTWRRVESAVARQRARRLGAVGLATAAAVAVLVSLVPGGVGRVWFAPAREPAPAAAPPPAAVSPPPSRPSPSPSPTAAPSPPPSPSPPPPADPPAVPAPPPDTAPSPDAPKPPVEASEPPPPPAPTPEQPPRGGLLIAQEHGDQGPIGPLTTGQADGSGCTPGPGVLPDGLWFAALVAVPDAGVEFDLLCRYSDERAAPFTDARFWYSNQNPALRVLPIRATATFFLAGEPPEGPRLAVDGQDAPTIDASLAARRAAGGAVEGWLRVEDGEVTEFLETLRPPS